MKIAGRQNLSLGLAVSLCLTVPVVLAQDSGFSGSIEDTREDSVASFRIVPSSIVGDNVPLLSISRNVEARDVQGTVVEDALNFNLGIEIAPIKGLNLRADAWQQQIKDNPGLASNWQGSSNNLYIDDSDINEFNLDNPLLGSSVESNGFDLGASYVWETNRFGQFTLSTQTTYVQEFENRGSLLELASGELGAIDERVISPELQSNLMLTWEFGNHTASAITNYFDSFKDISELDVEEINALMENITTVDLQYGYSIETSSNDRAIISFGVRNLFDEKTAQILNSTTRILDQNGRVAYGSIKYQF